MLSNNNRCTSECRKFSPNIFNKNKCTLCFGKREEHNPAALDYNRVSSHWHKSTNTDSDQEKILMFTSRRCDLIKKIRKRSKISGKKNSHVFNRKIIKKRFRYKIYELWMFTGMGVGSPLWGIAVVENSLHKCWRYFVSVREKTTLREQKKNTKILGQIF